MNPTRVLPFNLLGQTPQLRKLVTVSKPESKQGITLIRFSDELKNLQLSKFTITRTELNKELTDLYKGAFSVVISLKGVNKNIFKNVIANCLVNLTREGKRVVLCEPAKEIKDYLKRTRFDTLFEIYDTTPTQ